MRAKLLITYTTMSKKNNKAKNPEVEQPQVEEPQIEQPVTEQPESESEPENPEVEEPEVEQPEPEPEPEREPEDNRPAYVKELLEKGVVVLFGRTEGELNDMLANISSDIDFTAGAIGYYISKGLYRIQLNLKK